MVADEEYEGLTTGRTNLMCFPLSFAAVCCSSSAAASTASFTFSKVVLTAEEKVNYQVPWERQQKKAISRKKSFCLCWCCICNCDNDNNKFGDPPTTIKPVTNRKNRRVSNSKIERRADCYKGLIESTRPSIEQVHKWSSSFEDVVADDTAMLLFDMFLQQEHSDENLKFWIEVNKLKTMESENDKKSHMSKIYNDYLKPMSSKEINIAGQTRRKIEEDLFNNEAKDDVFDMAQNQVFLLMHRQSYPRFLASDLFHAVVQSTYAYEVASTLK